MMPNEGTGRGRAIRGLAVALVAIVLAVLAVEAWGPLTAAPASAGASASSGQAVVPSGATATGGATDGAGASPSPGLSPSPSPTAAPTLPPVPAAQLQGVLDRVRAKLAIPGVSVAIVWDDGRSWVGASGLRNIATRDPMTTGTAFALASISKTMTAAVVLELVEAGQLTLDQSVAPLLPAYKLDPRITVRMLLDHTSGLPDFFMAPGIDAALNANQGATWTPLRSWSFVQKKHAVPGSTWSYSNTNYLLLGELVTAVTGQPLAQEVRTRLLDPFGLSSAYYQGVETPPEAGTLAYRMVPLASGGYRTTLVSPASGVMPFRSVVTAAAGAGSIAATALDTARWMRDLAGGLVLGPDMQAQMLADVARTVKLHASIPYGLGIQRVTLGGYTAYGHSGRYIGIRNVVRYLPDLGITIAVMTNQSLLDPTRIAAALLKVVEPPPAPAPSGSGLPSASGGPSAVPSGSSGPSAPPPSLTPSGG